MTVRTPTRQLTVAAFAAVVLAGLGGTISRAQGPGAHAAARHDGQDERIGPTNVLVKAVREATSGMPPTPPHHS